MSDSAAADIQDRPEETATPPVPPYEPVRVVPTRPDGWPDWLGRRPVSSADRGKILKDLRADQDELNTVERRDSLQLAPLFSCLTIEGFGGQDDPRTVTRLRASINVACRVAAGDRRTSYHATDERITIGIAGPDARERIAGLRRPAPAADQDWPQPGLDDHRRPELIRRYRVSGCGGGRAGRCPR